MLRRLLKFLCIFSFVLCAATCVFWVRSYSWTTIAQYKYVTHEEINTSQSFPPAFQDAEVFSFTHRPGTIMFSWSITSGSGIATGGKSRHLLTDSMSYTIAEVGFRPEDQKLEGMWSLPGLALHIKPYKNTHATLHVRSGLLAFMFALMPMIYVARWWSRRRSVVAGLCASCGYDLRASPDRCPECGATAAKLPTPV